MAERHRPSFNEVFRPAILADAVFAGKRKFRWYSVSPRGNSSFL
jgi:hypothetical protein